MTSAFAVCVMAHGLGIGPELSRWIAAAGAEVFLLESPAGTLPAGHFPTHTDFAAAGQARAAWQILLYPWEVPDFAPSTLLAILAEVPAEIGRLGLRVSSPSGLSWQWSGRLQRSGASPGDWLDPGEALSDELELKQLKFAELPTGADAQLLAFLHSLAGEAPTGPGLQALLDQPWRFEPALLENLVCQAADRAIRAWNQAAAAEALRLGLERFPASEVLQFLASSLLSASGDYAACAERLSGLRPTASSNADQPAIGVWSNVTQLDTPDFLRHLQALLAFWRGQDEAARALLPAPLRPPPRPEPASLFAGLQEGEALMAGQDFERAAEILDAAIAATQALPLALRTWAREFVPVLAELPELGALGCHHLDLITLERLYPDRMLSRLLYARAVCELSLGRPEAARRALTQALANPMGSPGKIATVLEAFQRFLAEGPAGDLVELGCNQGSTSLALQTLLLKSGQARGFHVYDSFEGLPPPLPEDGLTPYVAGSCATAIEAFATRLQAFGLPLPVMHPGWFSQTLPQELPETIGFAYLDGDFYSSILESLEAIYSRLAPGATVLIDDYGTVLLQGVEKACDVFFADKPEKVRQVFSHGVEAVGMFIKI